MDLLKKIAATSESFQTEIAEITDLKLLSEIKLKYLGKKSELGQILKGLGKLSIEEKKLIGKEVNLVKAELTAQLGLKEAAIKKAELNLKIKNDTIDITLPGRKRHRGSLHPVSLIQHEIYKIFSFMGYTVEDGPEVETDYNCFEALNIPADHPARSMHDTFYFDENHLLRTHTSSVQVRTMLKTKPPIKILAPGRVFRSDYDRTHTPMFHQVEGLYVNKDVSLADLKTTLTIFLRELFGKNLAVRFRPSFFPFTEPSSEVDLECFKCKGKGCNLCKGTGWIEIMGCGMVHPNVLENVGIDSTVYSGFAFGMGIDRIAMLKFGIDDLRPLFENNIDFLKQF